MGRSGGVYSSFAGWWNCISHGSRPEMSAGRIYLYHPLPPPCSIQSASTQSAGIVYSFLPVALLNFVDIKMSFDISNPSSHANNICCCLMLNWHVGKEPFVCLVVLFACVHTMFWDSESFCAPLLLFVSKCTDEDKSFWYILSVCIILFIEP